MTPSRPEPLTSAQRRLWFVESLTGGNASYIIPSALRLRGNLQRERLHRALHTVVAKHPMLRGRIDVSAEAGAACQRIMPVAPFELPVDDLSFLPPELREARAVDLAKVEAGLPFDLQCGPPFRVRLIKLDDHEHLLVFPIHHLFCDGVSIRILNRDLAAAYGDSEQSSPSTDEARQTDVIVRHHADEDDARAKADLAYWTQRLDGVSDCIALPSCRARPLKPSFAGVNGHAKLPPAVGETVLRFAREHRITPYAACAAAFHAWLHRYTGEVDTVVGFAVSGRHDKSSREMIGLLTNLLVQRATFVADPSPAELAMALHRDVAAASQHDSLRFDDLVRERGGAGRLDRHPIFQVLFDYFGAPSAALDFGPDITAEASFVDNDTARFDLEVILRHASEGGLDVTFKCSADLFDQAAADRMASHLAHWVPAFLGAPDKRVSLLPLMPPDDRQDVLEKARGPIDPTSHETLLAAIATFNEGDSDRIVLTSDGVDHSYGTLARHAAALAESLSDRGARPESIVAICAPRGYELIAGLLGIVRSGAAFLPIDPDLPHERIRFMLEDASPVAILATASTTGCLPPGLAGSVIAIAETAGRKPPECDVHRQVVPVPTGNGLAYVLYTSGSTGRPKGVANTNAGILNRLRWMERSFAIGPGDRILQKTSIGFDVSVWELLLPFVCGARLVMAPPQAHRDPSRLAETIRADRITVVHFVPSMLRAFVDHGGLSKCASVRLLVTSGEALGRDLRDAVVRHGINLQNLYGPTEAAIDVTQHDCAPEDSRSTIPIGRPVPGAAVHVLDRHFEPVPYGVIGEICIGGVQVAREYVGRPALTAERFVPDPLGQSGARLYRTGDLGCAWPDGAIEFVGRIDDQIKLNGNRIEPGEVEAALQRTLLVSHAVVCVDANQGRARLVAFAVPRSASVTSELLRVALASELPPPMIPAVFVLVDGIPLLSSGKVDRKRLPWDRIASDVSDRAPAFVTSPATPTEKALAAALSEVLGTDLERIDVRKSFFEAGGDSIRSIYLVAAARRRGLGIRVEDIFLSPAIRDLALRVQPLPTQVQAPVLPFELLPPGVPIPSDDSIEDAFALSEVLASLVITSSTRADYQVYVTSLLIEADFEEAALRKALREVVATHPFLRSSIVVADGAPSWQRVHRSVELALAVHDWRDVDPPVRTTRFDSWFKAERERGFEWGAPPLWRLTCHWFADGEFRLTFAEPYLDGWSATLVLSELLEAYRRVLTRATRESEGSAASASAYLDFLRAERSALASEVASTFWTARLQLTPTTLLPGFSQGSPRGYLRLDVPIDGALSQRLRAIAQELSVPVKTVLLAAHMRAVAALSGQAEVSTGVIANARPETEEGVRVVGLFLNVTPIAANLRGSSWKDLILALHAAEAETLPHRSYPFARMLAAAGNQLPSEALFNFTHFHAYGDLTTDGAVKIRDYRACDKTYFPLTAQFRQDFRTGTLQLSLEFGMSCEEGGQLSHRTAACFLGALTGLANGTAHSCALIEPDERALAWTRAAPMDAGGAGNIHAAFERQAAVTPEAMALTTPERSWTYEQVSYRVVLLAQRLVAKGIQRGNRVGVCVPRSPELVVAALAVFRLGAVYVPLDSTLPVDRLQMLADLSKCALIVSTEEAGRSFGGRPTVRVDDREDTSAQCPISDAVDDPNAPAYLIFTSGSTGAPKAAEVPHRCVMNRLHWQWSVAPWARGEVSSFRSSPGFVDSVAEMFSALLAGVPTFVVEDVDIDPGRLIDRLREGDVTRVTLTPSLLSELLRTGANLGARLPRLTHWTSSGEPLATDLAHALLRSAPDATLVNLYGSTEVAADATWYEVTGEESESGIPIGLPIGRVRAVVMDGLGQPALAGVPGELAIGGLAVGFGYPEDEELTARRFVADPWGDPGSRLYLTGDLAVRGEDGLLRCLGRADRQIKVRGVRIEPAEIEAALRRQPGVLDALVVAIKEEGAEVWLVGYVLLPSGSSEFGRREELATTLRSALLRVLHSAAVPQLFVAMDTWPRTSTGKIDVRRLPVPLGRVDYVAPKTIVERELAALWERAIDARELGRLEDFFGVGGHSLSAITLASAIRERFGIQFSVRDVFDQPVLMRQAREIEDRVLAASAA